jgi:hypothetical protein
MPAARTIPDRRKTSERNPVGANLVFAPLRSLKGRRAIARIAPPHGPPAFVRAVEDGDPRFAPIRVINPSCQQERYGTFSPAPFPYSLPSFGANKSKVYTFPPWKKYYRSQTRPRLALLSRSRPRWGRREASRLPSAPWDSRCWKSVRTFRLYKGDSLLFRHIRPKLPSLGPSIGKCNFLDRPVLPWSRW